MRQILLSALLASSFALPAAAQPTWRLGGVLIEPRHPTTSDPIRLTVVGEGQCYKLAPVYDEASGFVIVAFQPQDCISVPSYHPIRETFEIGPLPAGQHFVQLPFGEVSPFFNWRELFEVTPDTAYLDLGESGDLQVQVHWSNPRDGSSGSGHARRLARDSGAFWFFSPDNLEITVKILDGHAINAQWWVFIASMTDLQFEVEISYAGGPVKTYVQTAGANRNFIDINPSLEPGPPRPVSDPVLTTPEIVVDPEHPTSADPVRVEVAVSAAANLAFTGMQGHTLLFNHGSFPPPPALLPRQTAETTVGLLAPGIYRVDVRTISGLPGGGHEFGRTFEVTAASPALRLRDAEGGTFDIEVSFRLPGETGFLTAPGVPVTRDSAYFYFFDRENVEVTAKVLDGRGVNKHWWVFLASMTTVELEIEVTHCPPEAPPAYCITKTYVQPPGKNQNFLDTSTFFGEL